MFFLTKETLKRKVLAIASLKFHLLMLINVPLLGIVKEVVMRACVCVVQVNEQDGIRDEAASYKWIWKVVNWHCVVV